jgi:hypothetical protein
MLSLPVELRLPIIHHIHDSIYWPSFEDSAYGTIQAITQYNAVLASLALYHREWTAIAQFELFRNLYIRDEGKMKSLLDLLRGGNELRGYIKHSRRAVLGGIFYWFLSRVSDDLIELAEYCPDLEEISCSRMDVPLVGFRASYSSTFARFQDTDNSFHRTIQKAEESESDFVTHL